MIELIVGPKGKGKTKILLDKANQVIKEIDGSMIYIDKDSSKMYELNNKIRLIDISNYPVKEAPALIGFLCGLVSANRDIQYIFLDSFLKISALEESSNEILSSYFQEMADLAEKFQIKFVISLSKAEEDIPEDFKKYL